MKVDEIQRTLDLAKSPPRLIEETNQDGIDKFAQLFSF